MSKKNNNKIVLSNKKNIRKKHNVNIIDDMHETNSNNDVNDYSEDIMMNARVNFVKHPHRNHKGGAKKGNDSDNEYADSDTEYDENNESDESTDSDNDDLNSDVETDDDNLGGDIEIDDEDREITTEENKPYKSDVFDDKCLYKYMDDDSDYEDIEDIPDDDQETDNIFVPKEERQTKPFLTKYERVRIIGDRTKQISGGAKPLIKNVEHLSPKEIALLELENNIIPFIIERPLPNGRKERWYISELIH